MKNTTTQLAVYKPCVDLQQFRLVAEPTSDALANDVDKFSKISDSGMDMHILGTFLLGVSLVKLKKVVGTAKRGVHGGGDSGWMQFTAERFPTVTHRSLTNAVNFSKSVFDEWQNPKLERVSNLGIVAISREPLDFQLPENPEELKGLLTAIHDTMDGKTITACYRSAGRIREAQKPGNQNAKGRKKEASPGAALAARRKIVRENIEAAMLALQAVKSEFTILESTKEDDLLLTAFLATLEPQAKGVALWINKPADKRDAKKIQELFAE